MIYLILFVFGLIFWSFWGAVIMRVPPNSPITKIHTFLKWRSKCDHCDKQLSRFELIPVFSYIVQWGKCNNCKKPINPLLLWVELTMWFVFALSFLLTSQMWIGEIRWLSFNIWLGINLIISRILVCVLFFDIMTFELHSTLRSILTIFVLMSQFLGLIWDYNIAFWSSILLWWAFLAIKLFGARYVRKRNLWVIEWLWEWDVMLAITIWALFPRITQLHQIYPEKLIIFWIITRYIILVCLLWILYFVVKIIITKDQNQTIPLIPSMILAFILILRMLPYLI